MTRALPAFFDTMLPFLMGELAPNEVAARLGPCSSSEQRLELYQTLIWRERTSVLRMLFSATRRLAQHLEPGAWDELEREHLARNRSKCWEPNHVGESFPALIEDWCITRPAFEVLAEVADFEWLRFLVTTQSSDAAYFRGYDCDVPQLVDALDVAEATDVVRPIRCPVIVAVHRAPTGRAAWTLMGAAELAALARRRGLPLPAPEIVASEIDAAEERLTRRGVLSA